MRIACRNVATLLVIVLTSGCSREQPGDELEKLRAENAALQKRLAALPEKFAQEGTLTVLVGETYEVFYPIPYESPPNLNLERSLVKSLEQKADHFKFVFNGGTNGYELRWRAEGAFPKPRQ